MPSYLLLRLGRFCHREAATSSLPSTLPGATSADPAKMRRTGKAHAQAVTSFAPETRLPGPHDSAVTHVTGAASGGSVYDDEPFAVLLLLGLQCRCFVCTT